MQMYETGQGASTCVKLIGIPIFDILNHTHFNLHQTIEEFETLTMSRSHEVRQIKCKDMNMQPTLIELQNHLFFPCLQGEGTQKTTIYLENHIRNKSIHNSLCKIA